MKLNRENLLKELSAIENKLAEEQDWIDRLEEAIHQEISHRENKAYLRGLRASIVGLIQIADEGQKGKLPDPPTPLPGDKEE